MIATVSSESTIQTGVAADQDSAFKFVEYER